MGHAYEARLLPDRLALLFQIQAYATNDPEIRAYVRSGYRQLIHDVAELAGVGVDETWELLRRRDAAQRRGHARDRLVPARGDLPSPARHCLRARWCSWLSRRCSRCRCSASSATTTTSTTRRPRRCARATPSSRRRALRRAEPGRARAARTRRPTARPRRSGSRAWRACCAIPAWRRWSRTSRAATAGSSRATGAPATCWRRSRTTRGARPIGSRSGCARCRG